MEHINLASAWTSLLLSFSPLFTAPTAELFVQFASGWVLCTVRRTVCGILPFADPEGRRAHDAYHRFFPEARWAQSKLWEWTAKLLVGKLCGSGRVEIDLDDTLFHKSGAQVNGAGWWRDAVRSTATRVVHALGLNLVVMTLRIQPPWGGEPLGLPINMRLHRKGETGLVDLAAEMLKDVAGWLPERSFSLCADGFYASLAGRELPRMVLTSRMRHDAALYDFPSTVRPSGKRGPNRKKGARLATPKQMAPHIQNWTSVETTERGKKRQRLVYARQMLWYHVCGARPVWLIISRDPTGREKDDFFFTTDLAAQPAQVVERFSGRWCIEDTNKNVKQLLGGEEPQTWKGVGPERAAAFSLWLYSMVWTWYLLHVDHAQPLATQPWYTQKTRPSFMDALAALRQALWHQRIFAKSEKRLVPARIVRLLIGVLVKAA